MRIRVDDVLDLIDQDDSEQVAYDELPVRDVYQDELDALPPDMRHAVTIKEAADILGIRQDSTAHIVRLGRMPALGRNRRNQILIDPREVFRYRDGRQRPIREVVK